MLTARETRERIRVDRAVGGYYVAFPLRLQPAKLVKGLAAACVRRGVKIFENSPVIRIADHEVSTASASVDCATVLMCTEGYVHEFPVAGFRPSVIAINSSMIATEPLTSTQWKEIGWSDYELFSDAAHVFTYAQRTDDGRIAIGGRGSPYRWNSRTGGRGVTPKKTIEHLVHRLLEYFPNAGPFRAAHAWSGCLGVTRDWCGSVSLDRARGLGIASGLAGHGVTATHLAGRILAEKTVHGASEYDDTPFVNHESPRWEPEPLRWVGINTAYKLLRLADPVEERSASGKTAMLARLGTSLSGA